MKGINKILIRRKSKKNIIVVLGTLIKEMVVAKIVAK
jgi:hypothetical protein